MELKEIFNHWAKSVHPDYAHQQWLLSKWEVFEGIEWSAAKIDLMVKTIAQGLSLKISDCLIDLGCGAGWILQALLSRCAKGVGLDISWEMLKMATRKARVNYLCGEIGQLPLRSESFDCALVYYVFLNFRDYRYVEQSLLEIFRILKPGGRALIGQLPDQNCSADYELAKADHLQFCQRHYLLGKNNRDLYLPPLRLFDRNRLKDFLGKYNMDHRFLPSFNPFFREGKPEVIDWRFDLILEKNLK